jgi:hypothetical protein
MRCSGSSVATAPPASPKPAPRCWRPTRSMFQRLQHMLELASTTTPTPSAEMIPLTRYLRPASQYAPPLRPAAPSSERGESE